jgi:uncharacterized membrane protein YfcA
VLPGPVVFDFVVAAVLFLLGAWLALSQAVPAHTTRQARLPRAVIGLIAAVAGCVGGIYGMGGGSILSPILVADGQPPSQVARPSRSARPSPPHSPAWSRSPSCPAPARQRGPGLADRDRPGAGGYAGARLHARMAEKIIRRLLALVVMAIGIRFLWAGLAAAS